MSDSTSAPISSSATEENQVPASNEQDPQAPVTEVPKARKKCLVLSLIRHGESQSNVEGNALNEDDTLTNVGRRQIKRLGENWSDVHIDALHSSTLERAYETALAIAKHNKDTDLEVMQKEIYVERKPGQAVSDAIRAGFVERAARLYYGPRSRSGVTPRDYAPPYGGESADDVAERATSSLLLLLHKYGKELDEPPKEFVDKKVIDSPNDLPEGIPHVVVVSHNIFLTKLYEAMYNWGRSHRMTTCDYRNVDCDTLYGLATL